MKNSKHSSVCTYIIYHVDSVELIKFLLLRLGFSYNSLAVNQYFKYLRLHSNDQDYRIGRLAFGFFRQEEVNDVRMSLSCSQQEWRVFKLKGKKVTYVMRAPAGKQNLVNSSSKSSTLSFRQNENTRNDNSLLTDCTSFASHYLIISDYNKLLSMFQRMA